MRLRASHGHVLYRLVWSLGLVLLTTLLVPTGAEAATFAVDSETDAVDATPGDGLCATVSLPVEGIRCTLRAAISEANALAGPDSITLPAGNFGQSLRFDCGSLSCQEEDANLFDDFDIVGDLTITGAGFDATLIGPSSPRAFHIVSGTILISDLRIWKGGGGSFIGNYSSSAGAGIRNSGSLELRRVKVTQNRTYFGSISAILSSGPLAIYDSEITQNTLTYKSSGTIVATGSLTMQNVLIADNDGDENNGGVATSGISTFTNVTFRNNGVSPFYSINPPAAVSALTNTGTSTLTNVQFEDNSAGGSVGTTIYNTGSMTMTGVTIARSTGRAVVSTLNSSLAITNASITANNSGSQSGAAISNTGAATVLNSIIAGNVSTAANAQAILGNVGGTLTLKNTIVSSSIGAQLCSGTIVSQGHNLETGRTCPFTGPGDLQMTDPKIDNLASNGGGAILTHRLLPGSPAIDAGENIGCPSTDQRGLSRPREGDAIGAPACDIGAFEVQDPYPVDLSVEMSETPDPVDTGSPLTYILTVKNLGGATALGVSMLVNLPAGATLVSAESSQGTCQGGGPVSCSFGTLPGEAAVTVTVAARPMVSGTATASAQVAGTLSDSNLNNNTAAVTTAVRAACLPRPKVTLSSSRIGPGTVRGILSTERTALQPSNAFTELQIAELTNSTLTVNGVPATVGQAIPLSAGTTQVQVEVTRSAPGAFTARMVATDACGPWPTFLGGGIAVP